MLTFGLGMCEGVGEDSRHGIGHVDIQVGSCIFLCETPENPNFLRKDKMVISVKIRNFSRSRRMKRTSPLESSREI